MRALANAHGFEVKPWRIVLVVASIMFPPLVAAYIIAWIALPAAPAPGRSPAELSRSGSGAWAALAGLGIAAWLVVEDGARDGGLVVAAILVGAGILLWRSVSADRPPSPAAGPAGGANPPGPTADPTEWAGSTGTDIGPAGPANPAWPDPAPGTAAPAWSSPTAAAGPPPWSGPPRWGPHPTAAGTVSPATSPGSTSLVPVAGPSPPAGALVTHEAAPWSSPPPWTDDVPPAAPRHRPPVTGITLAFVPVLLGLALGGDAIGWWSMSVAGALGLALATVGAGLVIGAVVGAGRGLALVALALVPATILTSTFPDVSLRGAWGDRQVTAANVAEASAGFEHGVGQLTVDLGALPADATATVPVTLGVGELIVLVPEDVNVVVAATVGAGELEVGDRRTGGTHIDEVWSEPARPSAREAAADATGDTPPTTATENAPPTTQPAGEPSGGTDEPSGGAGGVAAAEPGTIRLELEAGFGHINVERVPREEATR
jgi:hypothetical protein